MMQSKHGFNPADEHKKKHSNNNNNNNGKSSSGNDDEASLVTKARDVFTRVPTLWALFCEILACKGLSTLLIVLCVTKVSEVISDDTERAGWMGKVRIYTALDTTTSQVLILSYTRNISFFFPNHLPISSLP